ncbi:hypothetical protein RF11_12494 [Thelohanellus kitauei]|uniref:Tc1-like transposase DDE domain-containing protein n=1 Tax=Thelohanellus kitauei TaxID=669202 RepID=A0A0C2JUT7_THEKT|nr:hypothetical protein RF11_12494 [Thelohanellus kitauei]
MSCEGLINFRVEDRHDDSESFQKYLLDILEILKVKQIDEAYLVMNNLQIQNVEHIRNKISEFKHLTLFMPPYSPFLNPVENLFAKWQELVRHSNSRTAAELFSTIETCSASITVTDCFGFYRNMKSYLRDCIQGRPIEN